jgi:hypothetical protein
LTKKYSDAAVNFIAENGSWKDLFDNGSIELRTGAQPANANAAVTGTLLYTLTSGGAAKTDEVLATGVLTLSGTTSGSVDTLTLAGIDILGGAAPYNASLAQTATDVALKVNRNPANRLVVAVAVGAVITLTACPGLGAVLNAKTLTITSTGMTSAVTSTSFGSGTGGSVAGVTAINGLRVDYNAVAGVITKDVTQTWSGTVVGAGTQTVGWFRYKGSVADAGALDAAAAFIRMDGTVSTSGQDMDMTNTSVVYGAVQTLGTFQWTIPSS